MQPHGRARVHSAHPEAFALCDRCGVQYNHSDLQWQMEWMGPQLASTNFLVCQRCLDKPFIFFKPILLGPDPVPIKNPRPPWWWTDAEANPVLVTDDGTNIVDNSGEDIITANSVSNISGNGVTFITDDSVTIITDDDETLTTDTL